MRLAHQDEFALRADLGYRREDTTQELARASLPDGSTAIDMTRCLIAAASSPNFNEVSRIAYLFSLYREKRLVSLLITRESAASYRSLRSQGITIRETIDMLIGMWCIEKDAPLLHADRDLD